MLKFRTAAVITFVGAALSGCAAPDDSADVEGSSEAAATKIKNVTKIQRAKYIASAQVWSEDDFNRRGEKDLLVGPTGEGAFNAKRGADGSVTFPEITCMFVEPKEAHELGGKSPKFQCGACAEGCNVNDTLKVKFGKDADANGELYGEVMATRLFWALGFKTDDVYPVRVTCNNCPADPWAVYNDFTPGKGGERKERVFAAAVIERKYAGPKIEESNWPSDGDGQGFGFDEADAFRKSSPGIGAPDAQYDGFRLLGAFIKHADSKAANQRLACDPKSVNTDGTCAAPLLMMQDVGSTFGGAAGFLGTIGDGSKAKLKNWTESRVWKDLGKCQADLSSRFTLKDPKVSDAGRAWLVSLLDTITDAQLRDIFTAARIVERGEKVQDANGTTRPATVADWVAAFNAKRAELAKPCGSR